MSARVNWSGGLVNSLAQATRSPASMRVSRRPPGPAAASAAAVAGSDVVIAWSSSRTVFGLPFEIFGCRKDDVEAEVDQINSCHGDRRLAAQHDAAVQQTIGQLQQRQLVRARSAETDEALRHRAARRSGRQNGTPARGQSREAGA